MEEDKSKAASNSKSAPSEPSQRSVRRRLDPRHVGLFRPESDKNAFNVGGRILPNAIEMAVLSFVDLPSLHSLHLSSHSCRALVVHVLQSPSLTALEPPRVAA